MNIQMGSEGQVAKVTAVSHDGHRAFIEYRNGITGWFDQQEPTFKRGEELLNQSQGGNYILERWQRHGRCKHQCVGSGL